MEGWRTKGPGVLINWKKSKASSKAWPSNSLEWSYKKISCETHHHHWPMRNEGKEAAQKKTSWKKTSPHRNSTPISVIPGHVTRILHYHCWNPTPLEMLVVCLLISGFWNSIGLLPPPVLSCWDVFNTVHTYFHGNQSRLLPFFWKAYAPETLTWHLKIDPWKKRFLIETITFGGFNPSEKYLSNWIIFPK